MKGQIADKLNTEERCELKDGDFGIRETREFPMPEPISGMLLKIKKKSWHAGS